MRPEAVFRAGRQGVLAVVVAADRGADPAEVAVRTCAVTAAADGRRRGGAEPVFEHVAAASSIVVPSSGDLQALPPQPIPSRVRRRVHSTGAA